MAQLHKVFASSVASAGALAAAFDAFADERGAVPVRRHRLRISRLNEDWKLDDVQDFLRDYARGVDRAVLHEEAGKWLFSFSVADAASELTVRLRSTKAVRRVVRPLERDQPAKALSVFVGHGRNQQWLSLAQHLREQHGIHVISYESIAHYGQPASQVLDLAARLASVALLVHTAELESIDGLRHAVPNVVHETGLFSGLLGRHRALVIREDSCRPFTNIAGITELRFTDGNIREVFGDVVAELRRIERGLDRSPKLST